MPPGEGFVKVDIQFSIGASIDGKVASASKSRRSRKRRPPAAAAAPETREGRVDDPVQRTSASSRRGPNGPKKQAKAQPGATLGERPRAPWHPLPLSEILILVGAVGTIVGLRRGGSHGTAPLVAGLVAVGLGTLEVTTREHFSGYRSHAIILALLPVLVFHTVIVLGVSAFTTVPAFLTLVLLPLDVALFVFLFKLLRARFLEARRRRTMGR
jgi:hypothetical protein